MDARPRAARPATVGAASAQAGADPQPGEKRTATPFSEQGHAAEAQAVEPGGTAVVARAAAKKMGGVPARGLTRTAHHVGRADRKTGWSGRACSRREPAVEAFDDATGSGPKHRAGFRADPRRRRSLPARQLPGTNSTRRKFGRTAEAGRDHQARQPHAAHAAGGSGASRSSLRSPVSQRVSASLPSEAEGGGQGGSGAQVGGTTVLDAAHATAVSRDRSHRE